MYLHLDPATINEREEYYKLITTEYKNEFFGVEPDVNVFTREEITNFTNSLFTIKGTDISKYPYNRCNDTIYGYISLSDTSHISEKYIDAALYRQYVGTGIMKAIFPQLVSICHGMHINHLTAWTDNEKVGNSLTELGFHYVNSDDKKNEYFYTCPKSEFKKIAVVGSTIWKDEILKTQERLALQGNIVLGINVFSKAHRINLNNDQLEMLVNEVREKIDMADEVYAVIPDGNIGHNTFNDLKYAHYRRKNIVFSETPNTAADVEISKFVQLVKAIDADKSNKNDLNEIHELKAKINGGNK